jgi:lipoprotein NlpI
VLLIMRSLLAFLAISGQLAGCPIADAQDAALEDSLQEATQFALRGQHTEAIERLTEIVTKRPQIAEAWYLRGREHFRVGKIAESVADFDKYVELRPKSESQQWERGISFYYAGQFAKGAKQFVDYQTFHSQDVENSAWRYLCVARGEGALKAQATLLPIMHDPRVPMMQIYALYQGKLKPDEVLAAAKADNPDRSRLNQQLFYAHLYIGLWHEAAGRPTEAKEHILEAEKHKIAHYMWDVAHVHAERIRAEDGKK